jgi:hypothetical protein
MAITRAQQAKQMLQYGGRIGLKPGGFTEKDDLREQAGRAITQGKKPPTIEEVREIIASGPDRDTGLERARQRNIALQEKLLDTPYEGPKTSIPSINLLGNLIGGVGYNKGIKFYSDNSIGGKINPQTGKPFGYGIDGYKDYARQRQLGQVDAFGDLLNEEDDDDDQIFLPGQGIMTQAPGDMDQSSTEELSPIQQAILDRGTASAFLATGGRVGFFTGMRAQEQKEKAREDRRASQYDTPKSTTAKAPPSMGFGNPPPSVRDDRGGSDASPLPKKNRVSPMLKGAVDLGGDVSYLKNLIELNPVGIMKNVGAKILFDKILGDQTSLDTEDDNMKMAELSQKQLDFLNQPINQKSLKDESFGLTPKQIFDKLPSYEEKPLFGPNQEPTTPEEFNDYLKSIGVTQTVKDGGRIGAMDGGMMSPVGGIMDLESGRQMYFLGKLVKKATRAVKKIAKSPVGKAAIMAGLAYYGGGGGNPFTAAGRSKFSFANIFSKNNPLLFSAKQGEQVFSPFKASALFALSPLIFQQDTNEEDYQKFLAERGKSAQLPAPIPTIRDRYRDYMATAFLADGGRPEPVAKKTMPLLDMDGKEMDFRAEGGFVPIGRMERADDVPARLSKNEFVFTADAVRNAGEGDIDKGAEVMYNMMKNLEAGGEVSEESQGLEGAREMFKTSQRLEEVI